MTQPKFDYALEPRVAKLEVGLDRLTEDVRDLAGVVRTQGANVEQEIQKLVVAVTQAQGPRKTDWGVIIAACGLMMAIGSAAFWPLNQQTQDNKTAIEKNLTSITDHQKLDNHPVGAALVQRLEEQIKTHIANNERELKAHIEMDKSEFESLHKCFAEQMAAHEKLALAQHQLIEAKSAGIQAKNDLYIDKLFGRVVELEKERIKIADNEHAELMLWRQKAMGLTAPDAYVPLVPRGTVLEPKK